VSTHERHCTPLVPQETPSHVRWQKDRQDSGPMPGNMGKPSPLSGKGMSSSRHEWQRVKVQTEQCKTPSAGLGPILIIDLHALQFQGREVGASNGGL
jgi:hypothetical protein